MKINDVGKLYQRPIKIFLCIHRSLITLCKNEQLGFFSRFLIKYAAYMLENCLLFQEA